mmetsp:Transcript_4218/g.9074  ORF Transcript_4218/g.9074 Transcript_4218/m.9074 type:complete len:97 (+) Transcript_4218:6457-6747(+)
MDGGVGCREDQENCWSDDHGEDENAGTAAAIQERLLDRSDDFFQVVYGEIAAAILPEKMRVQDGGVVLVCVENLKLEEKRSNDGFQDGAAVEKLHE